jgi:4'-phosphopantetheinyl transferase
MKEKEGVHLWCAALEDFDADEGVLSPDELARAARFRMERHRRSYLVRHTLVRSLLGEWLGVAPGEIEIAAGPDGKPVLQDFPDLHFSLSSSDGIALVGVCREGPIGVDVERVTSIPDMEQIARRRFAPEEAERLLELPPDERKSYFFRLWARKEAYGKALGTGLAELGVRLDGPPPPGWALESIEIDGDYAGAAAWWIGKKALARAPAPVLTRLPPPPSGR